MYFLNIKIANYKGYRQSTPLKLKKGINIVVGKNNAGKTALLESLSLDFCAKPHRSIVTLPAVSRQINDFSSVTVTFSLTKDELLNYLIDTQENKEMEFQLPLPSQTDPARKFIKPSPG